MLVTDQVEHNESDKEKNSISKDYEKNKNFHFLNDLLVTVLRSETQDTQWDLFKSFENFENSNSNNNPFNSKPEQDKASVSQEESATEVSERNKPNDSELPCMFRKSSEIVFRSSCKPPKPDPCPCPHTCKECSEPGDPDACVATCKSNKCKSKCKKCEKKKKNAVKLTTNINRVETLFTQDRREFFVLLLAFIKRVIDDKDCTEKSFYKLMGKEKSIGFFHIQNDTQVFACDKTCKCPCEKTLGNKKKEKFDVKCAKKSYKKREKERKKMEKAVKKCIKEANKQKDKDYFCKNCCKPGKECNICKESRCEDQEDPCYSLNPKTEPICKPETVTCSRTGGECSYNCTGPCKSGPKKDPCDMCTCKPKKPKKKKKKEKPWEAELRKKTTSKVCKENGSVTVKDTCTECKKTVECIPSDCCQPMPRPKPKAPIPESPVDTNMEYLLTFLGCSIKPKVELSKDQQLVIGGVCGPLCHNIGGNISHLKSCLTCRKPKKKVCLGEYVPEKVCKPKPEPERVKPPCYAYNVTDAVSEILGSQTLGDFGSFECDSKNPLLYKVSEEENNPIFLLRNPINEKDIQTEAHDLEVKNTGILTSRCHLPRAEICSNENSCCKFVYGVPRCLVHNEDEKLSYNYCPSCTCTPSRKSVISSRSNKSTKSGRKRKFWYRCKQETVPVNLVINPSPGSVFSVDLDFGNLSEFWYRCKQETVPVNCAVVPENYAAGPDERSCGAVPEKRSFITVTDSRFFRRSDDEALLDENDARKHKLFYKYEYDHVPKSNANLKDQYRRHAHRRIDDEVVEELPEDEPSAGPSLHDKKKTTLKAFYTFERKPKVASREHERAEPTKKHYIPKSRCSYNNSTEMAHLDYEEPTYQDPRSRKKYRNESTCDYYAIDNNLPDFLTEPRRPRTEEMRQYARPRPRRYVPEDLRSLEYQFDSYNRPQRNISRHYERVRENQNESQHPQRLQANYDDSDQAIQATVCTMKPSARYEFASQTANKQQPLATTSASQSVLCPTLSLTNLCKEQDKQNLKSVYYLLTAIDGRVRRMKKSIPESSLRFR